LEARILLSITTWTGKGDGTRWGDPKNWNNGVPQKDSQVSINGIFSVKLDLEGPTQVASLSLGGGAILTLEKGKGGLTVGGIKPGAGNTRGNSFNMNNATLDLGGTNALTIKTDVPKDKGELPDSVISNGSFIRFGTILVEGGGVQINDSTKKDPTQHVYFADTQVIGPSNLYLNNGILSLTGKTSIKAPLDAVANNAAISDLRGPVATPPTTSVDGQVTVEKNASLTISKVQMNGSATAEGLLDIKGGGDSKGKSLAGNILFDSPYTWSDGTKIGGITGVSGGPTVDSTVTIPLRATIHVKLLSFNFGTISLLGTMDVDDGASFNWSGGTITGDGTLNQSGILVIKSISTLPGVPSFFPNILAAGVVPPTLVNVELLNNFKVYIQANVFVQNAVITNNKRGKIFLSDSIVTQIGGKQSTLTNNGEIDILSTAFSALLLPVTNNNTLWLQRGNLSIPSYSQPAGLTKLSAGTTLAISGGFTVKRSSVLAGYGTVDSNVINDGVVSPGAELGESGIGTLTITGNYTQTAGGMLAIGIASALTYDKLIVGKTASLAGALKLYIGTKYSAVVGDVFSVLSSNSLAGAFATPFQYSGTPPAFDPDYSDKKTAKLQVVASPASVVPSVSALSTSNGSTSGGTTVTITGSNLSSISNVYFGVIPATSFLINSDTSVTAVSPAQASGTVDVTLVNADGTSTVSSGDQFTYSAAPNPSVSSLSVNKGSSAGLDQVIITGSNFLGTTAVDFGSTAAPYFFVNSDTSITVVSPPGSVGTDDVTVTTYSGTSATSSADQFTYEGAPTVTGLSASTGTTAAGSPISLAGTNFTDATAVYFGNVPATNYTVNSDTSITVTEPPEAAGTVDVTVSNDSGTSATTSADRFTYNAAPAPTVTGLSVSNGSTAGGGTVVITGTGFTGATDVVFGNFDATDFIVNSDTEITAIDPSEPAGPVDVTVETFSGRSATSSADQFTYDAAAAPTVTSLSASSGDTAGGTVVTISGSNFTGATGVSFGNVATNFTVLSDGSITATVPAEASGTVDVTVTTYSGTSATSSADHYTYNAGAAPTVTGLSSSSGSSIGDDPVTILGTGFTSATGVSFGSVAADFNVNSDGSITAYAPSEAAGTVDVTVTTYNGTSATSSADEYTYTAASAPTVTSLSTTTGSTAGGTFVTLTGTGFTSASEIDIGGASDFDVTVNSDNQITFETPANAAGTWDVTVTNAVGTSTPTAADQFTYTLASTPSVSGLSSSGGSTAGGVSITISGSNFTGATAVNFGSVAADFTVNSDSSITATVPTQAAGTVDVTVTTYSGTSASSSADQYTYTAAAAPTVTGLATTSGGTGGGTMVTISGTGFTGATSVQFGSVQTADFTVNSDTSITVDSPGQSAGTVDVTVTTFGGTSATSSADRFTYDGVAPVVTALSASSGSAAGGYSLTITGSGFTGATAVNFTHPAIGGANIDITNVTDFTVNSDSSITLTVPVLAQDTFSITVTSPGGTSAAFMAPTFTATAVSGPSPTVTGVSPNEGPFVFFGFGGYLVNLTGSGFTGTTSVDVGTTAVRSFTINSDTSMTVFVSNSLPVGTYDITVTTANGTSSTSSADHYTSASTPAPSVTSLGTASGSTAGGTSVTISGSHFTGATAVSFGGVAATSFTVNSDTSITAIASPQAAGTVDVTVTTPLGTSATSSSDRFTYTAAPAPSVTSLGTTSGSTGGGTSVTISGSNFTGATGVFFGGLAATSFTVNSDTSITAIAPAQFAGTVDVTVSTYSGTSATSSSDRYSYTVASPPSVSSLGTSTGTTAGGTSVTISGSHFTGATDVFFGTVEAASFTVNSDTSITAIAPAQFAGLVDVKVVTYSGDSVTASADEFTYTAAAAPTVTGLSSGSGTTAGGATITITGTGFTGATAVNFGSVAASSFTVDSDTSITAIVPTQAAGTVDVTVSTYSGTSATSSADHYTYTAATAPTVTALDTSSGSASGGTTVTILGSGFTGATEVDFGTTAASYTVISDTSIIATAPAESAGTVDIKVTTYGGTSSTSSADHFTYNADSAPTVSSLGTSSGSTGGGTGVTITGTGFTTASDVSFGGTSATSFVINSDTSITAIAPATTAGTVDVTVTNDGGTSALSSADQYTFTAASAPSVSSLGSSSGSTAGGNTITISGSAFTGASSVTFGGVAADFTVNSDTSITATVPAETAGTVDVVVTTQTGTSETSSSDQYTYTTGTAPTVSGLSLTTGSTAGGDTISITGSNFTGATGVSFGTVAASFAMQNDGWITATVPAQAAGTVDVTVTTTSGTSSTSSADHYTYTAASAPSVSGVTASSGSTAGGDTVTVIGSGFTGATAVNFGTTAASDFTVLSDTSLVVTAPAGSAGTVGITVTTPSGTSSTSSADQYTYVAVASPTVTSLGTSSGSTAGGTVVVITGTNFTSATGVNFGSYAASFTINSATQITAVVPPQAAGTVDVTVTTDGGTSATTSADHFTYTAASLPTVTSVSIDSGPIAGGTMVTIRGSNFTGATAVRFGSVAASSFTVANDTTIFAVAPPHTEGTVDVAVSTYAGTSTTSSADQFTYPPLQVLNLTMTPMGFVVQFNEPFTLPTTAGNGLDLRAITLRNTTTDTVITGSAVLSSSAGSPITGDTLTFVSTAGLLPNGNYTVTLVATTTMQIDGFEDLDGGGLDGTGGGTPGVNYVNSTLSVSNPTGLVTIGAVPLARGATQSDLNVPNNQTGGTGIPINITNGNTVDEVTFTLNYNPALLTIPLNSSAFVAASGVNGTVTVTSTTPGVLTVTIDNTAAGTAITSSSGSVVLGEIQGASVPSTAPYGDKEVLHFSNLSGTLVAGGSATVAGVDAVHVAAYYGDASGDEQITSADAFDIENAALGNAPSDGLLEAYPLLDPVIIAGNMGPAGGESFVSAADAQLVNRFASGGSVPTIPATGPTGVPTGTDPEVYLGQFTATAGSDLLVPVEFKVTDPNGITFGSYQFAIAFDPNEFTIDSTTSVTTGSLTSPFLQQATVVAGTGAFAGLDILEVGGFDTESAATFLPFGTTGSITVLDLHVNSGASGFSVLNLLNDYNDGTTDFLSEFADFNGNILTLNPAPTNAPTDSVDGVVTITGTSEISSSDQQTFTSGTAPTVGGLSLTTGSTAGGTVVSITGSNFTGATGVSFGSVAASFTVQNDGWIMAVVPAQAAGTVDVTLTTASGTSATSTADQYSYIAFSRPTVTSLDTSTGSTAGGTVVVITGTNFTDVTGVNFGSYAASFTVNSTTQITAVVPPQAAGTVDVTVTTAGGTSATSSADQFTYTTASTPTVTSVSENKGPMVGGTMVTIQGSNFTGATAVDFGSAGALTFAVVNDTTIVAIVPPQLAGIVDVTVSTYAGISSTVSDDEFTYR
jgi:hypothetical protein